MTLQVDPFGAVLEISPPGNARARDPVGGSLRDPTGTWLLSVHVRFALLLLGCLGASRVLLLLWLNSRVPSSAAAWSVLFGGLRMDVIAISFALSPAVLLSLVCVGSHRAGSVAKKVLRAYLVGTAVFFLFMEIVTPAFILEYDSRPNRLFVEYLVHPREVSSMLVRGYRWELVITTLLTGLSAWAAWRFLEPAVAPVRRASPVRRVALFLVAGPALFLGARSSLQHRPANPSSVAFSGDHLLNDLCLSSSYSLAYAISQMGSEGDASDVYGDLGADVVVDEIRRAMVTAAPDSFVSDSVPTLHHQQATGSPDRPLNLVIILQESLGAQFVGALGGKPVTQFIDTLADEGWWFDRMYATGTRSVRGIEAVVSGFLPTPARSTVKLGLSQHGFFTLAEYLGARGYRTQFIYGGESHFDNMKRFFTGNGFDEIVDQNDFEDPIFSGSWGVCDEDILQKAHETLLNVGDEPIFSLVFSVSNHSPWEYPPGGFRPYDDEPATRNNAVRYADYALGSFFQKARRSPYWDNTVFVVVADHDSRVYGASLVPIEHFHIPGVILGPGVPIRRDTRVVSQVDLGPTLLSLLGVSGDHPMVGHDLTALPMDDPGRAIMQYGSNQAYLAGERAVVLQPRLPPSHFEWNGRTLEPAAPDPDLARRALAHALLPSMLYRERRYRMEATIE